MLKTSDVTLIDQIDHNFHHDILFLGLALGYHQGEGNKGVVRESLCAVRTIKDAVVIEKPQE